jgi:formate/nitrite transporter
MYMPAAVLRHKLSGSKFVRVLAVAYFGNLLGALTLAGMTWYSGILGDSASAAYAVSLANSKCSMNFGVALVRGVLCNWLVCLALYMTMAAADGVSKTILLWPPIMAFVALGFEHSVANMTFIPFGILLGSSEAYGLMAGVPALTAGWRGLLVANLVPVTLGNFIGGSVFVGLLYFKSNNLKTGVLDHIPAVDQAKENV